MKNLLRSAFIFGFFPLLFQNCGERDSKNCNLFEFSKENTVTVRLVGPATSLNPLTSRTGYDTQVLGQIFQSLTLVEPQTLEMVPLMIKAIPAVRTVEDGKFK
ncbi:MAG: hypothetical protein L6Q97_21290, partial [Thermoanaerobaculia bacterium]|nr:hypothetical protein [Thermoanaerobaculia bacterium]